MTNPEYAAIILKTSANSLMPDARRAVALLADVVADPIWGNVAVDQRLAGALDWVDTERWVYNEHLPPELSDFIRAEGVWEDVRDVLHSTYLQFA